MDNTPMVRTGRMILLVCCVSLAACAPIVRSHGYVPADDQLAEVEVGQDTRESVAEKIGLPLTLGIESDRAWYYVSSERRTFGPRKPKTVRRDIVAVRFTDDGRVANVERFDVEDGRVVILTARVTDPSISELGILRRIFGNVAGPSADALTGGGGEGG